MIYTKKIQEAIKLAIETHEINQKQKRKGKDVPYVVHPLTVGLILASAGAKEDVIVAGILHDTIEDSLEEKKVTYEIIKEGFGVAIADLVLSVTEQDKTKSWEDRKREAIEHVKAFSQESLLLKSADVLSNTTEMLEDYKQNGEAVFKNFGAAKADIIKNRIQLITAIVAVWKNNPLADELLSVAKALYSLCQFGFEGEKTARILEYSDYHENMEIECSVCGWKGTPKTSKSIEYYEELFDVSCPICEKMLLVVNAVIV